MFRPPLPNDLAADAFAINRWVIRVDETVVSGDLDHQRFWAHIARRLTAGDVITVLAVDGTLDVELRVTSTENGIVKVRRLREWRDAAAEKQKAAERDTVDERREAREAETFKVRWHGPAALFSIVNTITGEPVERKIATKREAEKRAAELNARALSAAA